MKALILYRSYYGNTKTVAETISVALEGQGYEAAIQDVRERLPDLGSCNLVIVGSPTRLKGANGKAKKRIRELKKKGFAGGLVAVFDTYGPVPTDQDEKEKSKAWLYPGAAGALEKTARKQGLNLHSVSLRCEVTGMEGPLAEGFQKRAMDFARTISQG